MYTLEEIITFFLPRSSTKERTALLERCNSFAIDYNTASWGVADQSNLSNSSIKENLIRTMYQTQDNYDGVVGEILTSLEIGSDLTLVFSELSDEDQDFYERVYLFFSFFHFTFMPPSRQLYILGSRFLLLGTLWSLPVISKIENHFARFCFLNILTKDSTLFAKAIELNPTRLGQMGTISDHIKKFISRDKKNGVEEYIKELKNKEKMDEQLEVVFWTILTLYEELDSGKIWQDINFSTCSHAKSLGSQQFDPLKYYLHRLEQTADLSDWLRDYEQIVEWSKEKPYEFIKKLMGILKIKVNLQEQESQEFLLNLVNGLEENGFPQLNGLIYYSESDSQFHWNEELLN